MNRLKTFIKNKKNLSIMALVVISLFAILGITYCIYSTLVKNDNESFAKIEEVKTNNNDSVSQEQLDPSIAIFENLNKTFETLMSARVRNDEKIIEEYKIENKVTNISDMTYKILTSENSKRQDIYYTLIKYIDITDFADNNAYEKIEISYNSNTQIEKIDINSYNRSEVILINNIPRFYEKDQTVTNSSGTIYIIGPCALGGGCEIYYKEKKSNDINFITDKLESVKKILSFDNKTLTVFSEDGDAGVAAQWISTLEINLSEEKVLRSIMYGLGGITNNQVSSSIYSKYCKSENTECDTYLIKKGDYEFVYMYYNNYIYYMKEDKTIGKVYHSEKYLTQNYSVYNVIDDKLSDKEVVLKINGVNKKMNLYKTQ